MEENSKMEWRKKAQTAYAYVSDIQKELELNEAKHSSRIAELESKKSEMSQLLNRIQSSHKKNYDIFSPFHDQNEKNEVQNIKKQIEDLDTQISVQKNEIEQISKKKEAQSNLIDCIQQLQKEKKGNNLKDQESVQSFYKEHLGIKILETQEMERNRIARELHDSTIQNLTSIVHKNELCMRLLDIDVIRAKLEMSTMNDNIRSIINNMRDIIYDLRPMPIMDLGLTATIQNYVKTYKQQNKIQVLFYADPEKQDIYPVVNLTLFRIVQEACNNIQKYAKASICKINLMYNDDKIQLEIEDNGCGFEVGNMKNISNPEHSGFGISIMRERALLLGGSFEIESKKDKGTKIKVSIPYQDHKGGISFGTDSNNNCR